MKTIKFPYIKYLVTPETVHPAQYVYRPVIPVRLAMGQKVIIFDGLIDSGADECTFPAWILKTLGHDLYNGEKKIFKGIGGSVLAYLHKTHLEINGHKFWTDVYYSHEWDDMPFGLLGQNGFFIHLNVSFNYKEKMISIHDTRPSQSSHPRS